PLIEAFWIILILNCKTPDFLYMTFLLILFVKNIFIYYNNKYEKAEIFYSCHNLDDFYFHYVTY
ncbi:hypothetical protein, partial [Thomasclavelia cocleata]|uniref:hypothetical protein n=1 Tax=Thomasclavelia cocleata TaxID=69824 RepID=UPI00258C7325